MKIYVEESKMNPDEKSAEVMPTLPASPIQIEGYNNIGFVQYCKIRILFILHVLIFLKEILIDLFQSTVDNNNQPPEQKGAENRANFQK